MKFLKVSAVISLLTLGCLTVWAQQQPGAQRPGRPEGQPAGPRGQWDPQQMRQRWMERIKENLQATDDEWKVIQPRLEKVMTLSRQTTGLRMMGGRRGGERPGGPGPAMSSAEVSPVQKAASELESVLANKEAKPAEIKAKLDALREARQKAKKELSEAQASLKEILTARQEAQLVLMGLLE